MIKLFSLREKCPNALRYGLEKTPYLDSFHAVFVFSELTYAKVVLRNVFYLP